MRERKEGGREGGRERKRKREKERIKEKKTGQFKFQKYERIKRHIESPQRRKRKEEGQLYLNYK